MVKSIDRENRIITLASDASYPIRPTDRYYVENAREELDAPGEWYLDREEGFLYFYPPEGCESADALNAKTVTAPVNDRLLDLRNVRGIEFRGLIFENAQREIACVTASEDVVLADCTIRNAGCYSSTALAFQNCRRCGVRDSEIAFIGGSAIHLGGGDVKTLEPGENFADGNTIHHTGIDYKQGVGVSLTGVGNRAAHNEIHDCPRFGIGFGGQNQIIEFNHIHHVNLETCDTGAIYVGGRNWISSYGTRIRFNYFHDVIGFGYHDGKWESPHFCWGIYLDDNTGGVDVYGNVIVGCVRGLIHLHNGRDNHIWNNIFIDGGQNQFEANGWTVTSSSWKTHFPTMVEGYESVAGLPAWKKMRHSEQHPKDAPLPDGSIMQGNRLWANIFYFSNPDSACFGTRDFSPKFNESDRNLIWNYAHPEAEIRVRSNHYDSGEPLRVIPVAGGGFESDCGQPGQFPSQCRWQSRPSEKTVVALDASNPHSGAQCLRIESDYVPEKGVNSTPALIFPNVNVQPGKTYRLSGWFRAEKPQSRIAFLIHHYSAGQHYWGSNGGGSVGTEWQKVSVLLRIPGPGDSNFRECMTTFNVTLGNPSHEKGTIWADDIEIAEMPSVDSLAYWQEIGFDRHSIVADPLFEDAAHGDYRLKKESPAWKLGFQPIPLEQIGPQKKKK